jgi:RNA polymerase sigma-70 factor (ECF subfamily)
MHIDDEAWLAGLFCEHSRAIRAFAFRRMPPDAVDDVVAEVFTLAWRSRARVPRDGRTLAWLYRTATHLIGHYHRGTGRRRGHEARDVQPHYSPDTADAVADRVVIARALGLLAPGDAEALRLAYWEDLSLSDVGFVLGCTTGAAKVRLHRARRRLQEVLAETDVPPEPARSILGEDDHDHA